jgi:hypothetical protein
MQCPGCSAELVCPRCNINEISRLNQLIKQLSDEFKRKEVKIKTRSRILVSLSLSIPISVTLYLNPALGKTIIDYLTGTTIKSTPSSGESISLDYEAQIQPNGFTTARNFTIEEPIKEVNINVDVECQNCIGQTPIIRELNEDDFQQFKKGAIPLPDDSSNRNGIVNYARYAKLTGGRYRIVIYNPSDHLIEVRYRAEVHQ